jgi:cytochrome c
MESFEINKILGAFLGTCLLLVAMHIASGAIFTPGVPAKPGYEITVKEEQPGQPPGGAAAPAEQPIENLLATASVAQGTQVARQCAACHNFQKGQGAKIGPDLYGVVGRPVASEPGFNYSAPLKAMGGTWTFDALNKWLTDPRGDVAGTLMTFAGLSSEKQRADVIAYLNTLSDNPLPLPKAKAAEAAPASPPAGAAAVPPAAAAPANPPAATPANPAPATPPAEPNGAAPQQK